MLFKACRTPYKKPHVSSRSRTKFTFFWSTLYLLSELCSTSSSLFSLFFLYFYQWYRQSVRQSFAHACEIWSSYLKQTWYCYISIRSKQLHEKNINLQIFSLATRKWLLSRLDFICFPSNLTPIFSFFKTGKVVLKEKDRREKKRKEKKKDLEKMKN